MIDERKITYDDVSEMTDKELCKILNIKPVVWFKDVLVWTILFTIAAPSFILMFNIIWGKE